MCFFSRTQSDSANYSPTFERPSAEAQDGPASLPHKVPENPPITALKEKKRCGDGGKPFTSGAGSPPSFRMLQETTPAPHPVPDENVRVNSIRVSLPRSKPWFDCTALKKQAAKRLNTNEIHIIIRSFLDRYSLTNKKDFIETREQYSALMNDPANQTSLNEFVLDLAVPVVNAREAVKNLSDKELNELAGEFMRETSARNYRFKDDDFPSKITTLRYKAHTLSRAQDVIAAREQARPHQGCGCA